MTKRRQSAAALVVAPVHKQYLDILLKDDNTRLCFLCISHMWPCDYQDQRQQTLDTGLTCAHEFRHSGTTWCSNKYAQRIAIRRSIEYLNGGGR